MPQIPASSARYPFPNQILDIPDLVAQQIQFMRQALNVGLGAAVDVVIELAA